MKFHSDDRAQRFLNVFKDMKEGQINVSYVNSTNHVVAWHKHEKQIDYWCCLKGSFKVGLVDNKKPFSSIVEWEYLSDKNPRVLKIEPGFWHGYRALEPGSIMLYYLTRKYNPSDEEKIRPGYFNEDWGIESK